MRGRKSCVFNRLTVNVSSESVKVREGFVGSEYCSRLSGREQNEESGEHG